MSAVCPACGVAVVSGYAKCPKCHAAMPVRSKRLQTKAGGTTSESKPFPVAAIAVPVGIVLMIVVIAKCASGGGGDDDATEPQAQQPVAQPAQPVAQQPAPVDRPFGGDVSKPQTPRGPDPNDAARELERALRGQRLWSTIEVAGGRVDVRSAACDEPQMGPTIGKVAATLRGAGLTRVRCVAQSGSVVFERDL